MGIAMDIAVIGMAGRFPGATDVAAFWRNLRDGVESITVLDRDQLLAEGIDDEVIDSANYVPAAAVLDDYDRFDARFFGFGAREAALLDPQQRLFLECVWHAIEDAGVNPAAVSRGGVFAGANMPAYLMSNLLGGRRIILNSELFELQIHNDKDYLATRTAHHLGFTGPAVSVQTACSTSLVAVHEGVRALLSDECDLVIAGGVCVRVPHRVGYLHERGMIYSPDGHCRPFDARGAGTVFGNGVGAVVLKRLSDATTDGDRILAVIMGSAVNNDGAAKVGYTAPSISGQERVIQDALRAARVPARTVTAIEAHGTATPIGDPIEINALTRAFRLTTQEKGFCAVGAVKANVGHLESAAGITGLIKAILQLQHQQLAPTVHFSKPNARIDFAATPFVVNRDLQTWQAEDFPRRIGVSAFGIGGTNAHVVLQEAPRLPTPRSEEVRPHLLILSAKTPQARDTVGTMLAERLAAADTPSLAEVAYTLQTGRQPMRYRRALLVPPAVDPRTACSVSSSVDGEVQAGRQKIVFLFPCQGSQYPGMGSDLYAAEPVFAEQLDHCAQVLRPELGFDLREVLLSSDLDPARLTSTDIAQPALFVTMYALALLLRHWGVESDDMVGHSLGELVAACLAEVLPLDDALRLVVLRGQLMAARPKGTMLAIHAAEDVIRSLLPDGISVAAVNAPTLCVAAGPEQLVASLRDQLNEAGIIAAALRTSHAFHSSMMDPLVEPLTEAFRSAGLAAPLRRFTSCVTGAAMSDEQALDPSYWGAHARLPVRFADALRAALPNGRGVFVEVGPGGAMSALAKACFGRTEHVTVIRTMRRADERRDDLSTVLHGLGELWVAGGPVNWAALHDQPRQRIALPGYPFERERYWIGPQVSGAADIQQRAADLVPDKQADHRRATRPAELQARYTAPRGQFEQRIIAVWEEILEYDPIGADDDFFELGGHSLMANRISNRIGEKLGFSVSMRDVMSAPTPALLAAVLAQRQAGITAID